MKPLTVAYDLDGTYLENPTLFDLMSVRIKRSGGKVGILTNRPFDLRITPGFIPDFEFYLGQGSSMSVDERCAGKAAKMVQEGIDLTFDDEANYFPDFALALNIIP